MLIKLLYNISEELSLQSSEKLTETLNFYTPESLNDLREHFFTHCVLPEKNKKNKKDLDAGESDIRIGQRLAGDNDHREVEWADSVKFKCYANASEYLKGAELLLDTRLGSKVDGSPLSGGVVQGRVFIVPNRKKDASDNDYIFFIIKSRKIDIDPENPSDLKKIFLQNSSKTNEPKVDDIYERIVYIIMPQKNKNGILRIRPAISTYFLIHATSIRSSVVKSPVIDGITYPGLIHVEELLDEIFKPGDDWRERKDPNGNPIQIVDVTNDSDLEKLVYDLEKRFSKSSLSRPISKDNPDSVPPTPTWDIQYHDNQLRNLWSRARPWDPQVDRRISITYDIPKR